MTGTRTLFLLLAAVALAILLQQPLCQAAHPKAHHATEPATCCADAAAPGGAQVLDQALDAGGKPLVAPLVFAYLAAAALFFVAVLRFASFLPPPRSYYARSARILR